MTRLAACLLGALLTMLVAAPGAAARTELTGSDPADGASVATAPRSVTLTFNDPVQADLAVIFVTGADGRVWNAGEITASGNSLTMPVTPSGPAGRCTISYNLASDHPASGQVSFTMTAPAPSVPPTTAAPSPSADEPAAARPADPGGSTLWIWLLVGVVIVGVAVGLIFAGTSRTRR